MLDHEVFLLVLHQKEVFLLMQNKKEYCYFNYILLN